MNFIIRPLNHTWLRFYFLLCLFFLASIASAQSKPLLTLANTYDRQVDLSQYYVSEKYDGVRAYWSGKQLLSRSGKTIPAPKYFLEQLPKVALDGELWFGRQQFSRSAGLIHRHRTHPGYQSEWNAVRYMVFDAPKAAGDFEQRLAVLQSLSLENTQIEVVKQWQVADHSELQQQLQKYTQKGAEGLMLRLKTAPYRAARSDDLLKVKQWQDAEAEVVAWLPGKGKYKTMMGALLVRLENGTDIKIGTGFSDAQRQNPPAIGSRITFKYQGYTSTGLPRFPVYWRERLDE